MIYAFSIPLLCLIGAAIIAGVTISLEKLGPIRSKQLMRRHKKSAFLHRWLSKLHRHFEWDDFFFILNATRSILLLDYAMSESFYLITEVFPQDVITETPIPILLLTILITLAIALVADVIIRIFSNHWPKAILRITLFPTSFLSILFVPLTSPLLVLSKSLFKSKEPTEGETPRKVAQAKILDLIQDTEFASYLDPVQRRLLSRVVAFQERIVREIMVPRVDVIALSSKATVHEAAAAFAAEQYSRIPVYQDTVDQICGVLLYKDLLSVYTANHKDDALSQTIESLVKPIIYAPETKKISKLLQEFRKKQSHLAIVVDEYGGTEGIVSIEDILEELVGEIEDEHDIDEEELATQDGNAWVLDARMSIHDIEKETGITIPPSPEYDTIGGYVFHRAGTIPAAGWRMHHEHFELEVLSSTDRAIEKVRILPAAS